MVAFVVVQDREAEAVQGLGEVTEYTSVFMALLRFSRGGSIHG